MKKVAITLNKNIIEKEHLTTIDSVYNYLFDKDIISLLISVERTEFSINNHYHILANIEHDNILLIDKQTIPIGLWIDEVHDIAAYSRYIIKQGNYKLYNQFELPQTEQQLKHKSVINAIKEGNNIDYIIENYPDYFIKNRSSILWLIDYYKNR